MESFKQKCECCGHDYEYTYKHRDSKDIKDLCLYFGTCKYKCWRELTHYDRNLLSLNSFIHNEKYRENMKK